MIEFDFEVAETQNRLKAIASTQVKPYFVLSIISSVLAIYFLFIGCFVDIEALSLGLMSLLITILMGVVSFKLYHQLERGIKHSVQENAENDLVHYTVKRLEKEIEITCPKAQRVVKFSVNDINRIYFVKKYMIVKLKSKLIIDLPNQKNILDLLIINKA